LGVVSSNRQGTLLWQPLRRFRDCISTAASSLRLRPKRRICGRWQSWIQLCEMPGVTTAPLRQFLPCCRDTFPAMKVACLRTVLLLIFCTGPATRSPSSQAAEQAYLAPFPPHKVIANIYFVGSKDLGVYLVTTSQGHILINSGLEESIPMIQRNVESLGF